MTKTIKLIPTYLDKDAVDFVKQRNKFAKIFNKVTGKILRPLWGQNK